MSNLVRLLRRTVPFAVLLALASAARADAPKSAPARGAVAKPKPLADTLTGGAKADYQAGKLLFGDGDYAGALIKFTSAYDTSKDPRLLWNIAACQKGLRHYAKALGFLKRYSDEGGAMLTPADRKDAADFIQLIEPLTTKITFKVNEEGAQIVVDDERLGTSPLPAPPILDVGEHKLRVTKDGFVPFDKTFPVGGSADVTVQVDLVKIVREGHLIVNAPAGATVLLDDKPLGRGKVDQTIPSGGHQLRVTAPGMRPFQSEIGLQDKETRSVDVTLEPEAAAALPRIRVAVLCGGDAPRGPDDGLVAYLDGPEVLQPVNVKKRWDQDGARNVVEQVEYQAAAGTHTLQLRAPGCVPVDRAIAVDAKDGVDVVGEMDVDRFALFRGPQGSPGWWRVALSFWAPAGGKGGCGGPSCGDSTSLPESYTSSLGAMKGGKLALGLVGRWAQLDVSAAVAGGSWNRTSHFSNFVLPETPSTTWSRYAVRGGFRIPFAYASFGIGGMTGLDMINISQVRTGKAEAEFGAYVELDVQPICEAGFFLVGSGGGLTVDGGYGAVDVGVFLEPSTFCRHERDTVFGLRTKGETGAAPK